MISRVIQATEVAATGDAYLDAEASAEDSQPIELIKIVHGTTVHLIATGTQDVVYSGQIYTAIPAARGELGVETSGNSNKELTITLPIDHALPKRWTALGVPPKQVTVTLVRLQGANAETKFVGHIQTFNPNDDGTEAVFRARSRVAEAKLRVLPNQTAGRTCPYSLYDSLCGVSRSGSNADGIPFKCTTTVQYVNGREVRFDLSNVPAGNASRAKWLRRGELVHTPSGEQMSIREQADTNPGVSTVTTVTMQAPIHGMKVGDAIDVYAGCGDLDIAMCHGKFGNRANFGGAPLLPTNNPFLPEGVGPE